MKVLIPILEGLLVPASAPAEEKMRIVLTLLSFAALSMQAAPKPNV
ncbi:uncharacterized protein METZ01_LOCUS68737, partial [marine metagenome]